MQKITLANGRATLYHGDCLDLLASGALKSRFLVSDPPYGIGFQHSGNCGSHITSVTGQRKSATTAKSKVCKIIGDDSPFDPAPWLGYECLVLFGADHFRARLPAGGKFLCWDKAVGQGAADSFADAEFAWTNLPTIKRTVHRQLWKGMCMAGADSLRKGKPRYHLSQKPRELMRWCIEMLKPPAGAVIVDPYMGSGSTGIAALGLGMRFVGVEIDAEHFAVACQRIERFWAEHGEEQAA